MNPIHCLIKHHSMKIYGGGERSGLHHGRLTAGERASGTNRLGRWAVPRAGLDAVAKRKTPSPCWELKPDRPARSLVAIED